MQHRTNGAQQLAFFHRQLLVVRYAAHQSFDEHLLGERPQFREAREGIADLERRLATARDRLEKATAELKELGGIRADRTEQERAARAALDELDAGDRGD